VSLVLMILHVTILVFGIANYPLSVWWFTLSFSLFLRFMTSMCTFWVLQKWLVSLLCYCWLMIRNLIRVI